MSDATESPFARPEVHSGYPLDREEQAAVDAVVRRDEAWAQLQELVRRRGPHCPALDCCHPHCREVRRLRAIADGNRAVGFVPENAEYPLRGHGCIGGVPEGEVPCPVCRMRPELQRGCEACGARGTIPAPPDCPPTRRENAVMWAFVALGLLAWIVGLYLLAEGLL